MGMSMYTGNFNPAPCANCGKEGGGLMGSSEWNHSGVVCNRACGLRLHKKIENGMAKPIRRWGNGLFGFLDPRQADADRMLDLRIRIKQLEHRLRELQD